jgi:putative NADH-flavin reductase
MHCHPPWRMAIFKLILQPLRKKVFIAGAARPIGISLLKRLKNENVEVTSLVTNWRERIKVYRLCYKAICAPLFEPSKWREHVKEHDVLIYCNQHLSGKENSAEAIDLSDELFSELVTVQQVMQVQGFMYMTNLVKPDDRFYFLEN